LHEQSKINIGKSEHVQEVTLAWDRLNLLRQRLGEDAPSLENITLTDINSSRSLRKVIMDYNSMHFLVSKNPIGSF
jgi:hypothetical protein